MENLPCASFTTSQQRRAIGGPFEDRLDEQDAELSLTDAVQVKSLGRRAGEHIGRRRRPDPSIRSCGLRWG